MNRDSVRAHHVEQRKKKGSADANQPRTIVCHLHDWKQLQQVLRKACWFAPQGGCRILNSRMCWIGESGFRF